MHPKSLLEAIYPVFVEIPQSGLDQFDHLMDRLKDKLTVILRAMLWLKSQEW